MKQPKKRIAGAGKGQSVVDWAPAFLSALCETAHIGRACEAASTSYSAVWQRRKHDETFAAAYDEAVKISATLLEAEAVRRAKEGLRRMKFNSKTGEPYIDPGTGQPYVEHEYSDTLLLALLKRHYPELYRERTEAKVEHTGSVNTVQIIVPQNFINRRSQQALPEE